MAGSVEAADLKAGMPILEADQTHRRPFARMPQWCGGSVPPQRQSLRPARRGGCCSATSACSRTGRGALSRSPPSRIDADLDFIPREALRRLCEADEHFADFVELGRPRLKAVVEEQRKNNEMMVARVRKLITRAPLIVEATDSVQEAARRCRRGPGLGGAGLVDAVTENPRYTYTDD
ncbi:MAG: hypothetical protein U5L11_15780 [Arhodomonas sp.]|nr:hypothetical protein [Arhodomonas sp.]